jgi:Concanavalin A-like lectin/glucanases superfamily
MNKLLVLGASAFLALAMANPAAASVAAASWHMDESSGQMIDSSGNGNNGILKGGVTQGQTPAVSGSAYRFDGSSGVVIVPSSTSLNPGTADITLTAHVNFTKLPPTHDYDIFRKGLGSTPGGDYKMEIMYYGRVLCLFQGSGGTVKRIANLKQPAINDGRYHTLQCVKNSSGVTVLVDGRAYGTRSGNPGSISNSADLSVGAKNTGGDWYEGLLDDVSVEIG